MSGGVVQGRADDEDVAVQGHRVTEPLAVVGEAGCERLSPAPEPRVGVVVQEPHGPTGERAGWCLLRADRGQVPLHGDVGAELVQLGGVAEPLLYALPGGRRGEEDRT